MGGEGWLTDPDGYWVKRFHRDQASWSGCRRVFVDEGRGMPNGEPALLKRRQYLRRDQAEQLWKTLRRQGWRPRTLCGVLAANQKDERALNPSQRVLLSLIYFGFFFSGGMTKS